MRGRPPHIDATVRAPVDIRIDAAGRNVRVEVAVVAKAVVIAKAERVDVELCRQHEPDVAVATDRSPAGIDRAERMRTPKSLIAELVLVKLERHAEERGDCLWRGHVECPQ